MKHLRLVTRRPAVAQTGLALLLNAIATVFGTLVGAFDGTTISIGADTPGFFRIGAALLGKNVGTDM